MTLLFAPHTVTIQSVSQAKGSDKRADAIKHTEGATIKAQISPADPGATYTQYGVELKRPHKMLLDIADVSGIKLGDYIVWGSRKFAVSTPVKISQHGLITDHAKAILEEQV